MAALAFIAPSPPVSGLLAQPQAVALRGAVESRAAPENSAGVSLSTGFLGGVAWAAAAAAAGRRRSIRSATICRASENPAEAKNVKVGDQIPNVSLDKGFPPTPVPLGEFCKGKKIVLVGLPGAFTPT